MRDGHLLEQARRFAPDALRALHNRFYQPVYRYVYLKTGDLQTSQDLTGEVFVRVLEKLKQGRGWRKTPDAWLFGIARNVVADHYCKRYKQKEVLLSEHLTISDEDRPAQQMIIAEQKAELVQAIAALTGEQRDVILLRFMEGLSIKEVAEALNKTPGAIKALQHRAVRALSETMQQFSTGNMPKGAL